MLDNASKATDPRFANVSADLQTAIGEASTTVAAGKATPEKAAADPAGRGPEDQKVRQELTGTHGCAPTELRGAGHHDVHNPACHADRGQGPTGPAAGAGPHQGPAAAGAAVDPAGVRGRRRHRSTTRSATPGTSRRSTGTARTRTRLRVGMSNYTAILHDPVFWNAIGHTVAVLRRHLRRADVPRLPVRGAAALQDPARGAVQGDRLHPGGARARRPWRRSSGRCSPPTASSTLAARTSASARWPSRGSAQSSTALPVIMFITIWKWTGVTFVLYYAAMTQIEPEILEAARMDGAEQPPHAASASCGPECAAPRSRWHARRDRRAEDLRRAVPGDDRRAELRHRVPRHLHLPHQHPAGTRRLRCGAVNPACSSWRWRGAVAIALRERRSKGEPRVRGPPLSTKVLLQVLATLLVIPYLFPLIVMVQGSLSGQGWGNYRAVFAIGAIGTFFMNSIIIAVCTHRDRLRPHHAGRVRLRQAAHPREGGLLLDAAGRP